MNRKVDRKVELGNEKRIVDENQSMVARLREAAEKLNDWEDSHRRSQYTRKMVCSNKEI